VSGTGDGNGNGDEKRVPGAGFDLRLVREDETVAVEAEPDETVLEAAERAGRPLPFGCLTGACGTCTARLLSGEVEHVRAPGALKPRHLDAGYVLTCIAVPRTDCRLRVGAGVAGELVTNPWK
jgi:ferredoxin